MAVKKQWYEIVSPKLFGEKVVGETLALDPKQLIGRKVETSLGDVTNDFSKFYVKLIFQIDRVDEKKAYTIFKGHEILTERIYRMVQRRTRRVDVIQIVETKDNRKVRIKTLFILVRRVNTSIKGTARKKMRELIEEYAKKHTFEEFMTMAAKGTMNSKLRKECGKIYPIGDLEIRKTEVLD